MFIVQSHKESKELLAELTIGKATRISLQHALGDKKAFFCWFSKTAKPPFFVAGKIVPCITFPLSASASQKGGAFQRKLENKKVKEKFLGNTQCYGFQSQNDSSCKEYGQ